MRVNIMAVSFQCDLFLKRHFLPNQICCFTMLSSILATCRFRLLSFLSSDVLVLTRRFLVTNHRHEVVHIFNWLYKLAHFHMFFLVTLTCSCISNCNTLIKELIPSLFILNSLASFMCIYTI